MSLVKKTRPDTHFNFGPVIFCTAKGSYQSTSLCVFKIYLLLHNKDLRSIFNHVLLDVLVCGVGMSAILQWLISHSIQEKKSYWNIKLCFVTLLCVRVLDE